MPRIYKPMAPAENKAASPKEVKQPKQPETKGNEKKDGETK